MPRRVTQVADLFGSLIPEIRLARAGRYLLGSADRDRRILEDMVAACEDESRRGPVDPRPYDAAARGDGHVQEAIAGDLTAMWRWFTGVADQVEGAPALPPLDDLERFPCRMTMSAWDGGFSGTFSVRRERSAAAGAGFVREGALKPRASVSRKRSDPSVAPFSCVNPSGAALSSTCPPPAPPRAS